MRFVPKLFLTTIYSIINLNCYSSSNHLYLTYLVGLNSWSFNFLFVLTLFFIYFNFLKTFKVWLFYLSILFYYFFNFTIFSYLSNNHLPSTLMIGALSIHPSVFYWFLITTILVIFYPQDWALYKTLNFKKYTLLKWGILALLLGGLWGSQSLTWGFVWVNDNIEWLLLYVLIFVVYYLHSLKNFQHLLFFFLILFYINLLLLLRLNFLPSRHSFLGLFTLNFIIIFLVFNLLKQFFLTFSNKNLFKISNTTLIFFWTNFFFVTSVVSVSIFKYLLITFIYYYLKKLVFTSFVLHFFFMVLILSWINYTNVFFLIFSDIFDLYFNFFIFEENVLGREFKLLSTSSLYTFLEQLSFIFETTLWQTNHLPYFVTQIICNNLTLLILFIIICIF